MNVNTGGAEEKLNSNTFMSVTMYTRNKNDVMGSKAVLMLLCVLCVCVRSVCMCALSLSLFFGVFAYVSNVVMFVCC